MARFEGTGDGARRTPEMSSALFLVIAGTVATYGEA